MTAKTLSVEPELRQEVANLVGETVFDAARIAIKATPVDTGQARAGWMVSSPAPRFLEVPRPPAGATIPAPDPRSIVLGATITAETAFEPVHLTNGVRHAAFLDEGSSAQNRSGMTPLILEALK